MKRIDQEFIDLLEELKDVIRKKGLKYTKQREIILQTLYQHSGHHSPEEILMLIKKSFPKENIGIATIYRTLALFEEEGLVDSISFGKDGKKYEIGHKEHHDHLVCLECGKIIEFVDEIIESRQIEVSKKYNFKMIGHTMKIVGICNECQNKN
ncbi:MAG: transcriptional repressor [Epsilonproteobacteria bacterium]|nr:transcriptional repressor [Campylobacterota bacterium]